MTRRLLNHLTALSLLLCLAVAGLWAWSFVVVESFVWHRRIVLAVTPKRWVWWHEDDGVAGAVRGRIVVRRHRQITVDSTFILDRTQPVTAVSTSEFRRLRRPAAYGPPKATNWSPVHSAEFLGFEYEGFSYPQPVPDLPPPRDYYQVVIPAWMPRLVTGLLPVWGVVRLRRRAARRALRRQGRCESCGYDLRATPARCPECGHQSGTPDGESIACTPPAGPPRTATRRAGTAGSGA